LHLLAEDKDQEFDGCRQDSEGTMWNFQCCGATGNKGSVQETVYALEEVGVEGRYWKLIDEKAHQSTEGSVTSSPA